jgi:hypothetical protein
MIKRSAMLFFYWLTWICHAEDLPCKDIGISHCNGVDFVCNDDSIEKKKIMDCADVLYNPDAEIPGDINGDGVLSASEQYFYRTESKNFESEYDDDIQSSIGANSNSSVQTGKRGGRYTITPGGNKSYLPRSR